MYYVIFLDDNGKLHVPNREFTERDDAVKYKDGVAVDRHPIVVTGPAIPAGERRK